MTLKFTVPIKRQLRNCGFGRVGHWSVRPLLHAQNRSILVTPPFDLEEVAVELAFKEEDLEQIREAKGNQNEEMVGLKECKKLSTQRT